MRKLIYWFLGAVTFIFVVTSTIWKQVVSLSLCGILGFNSVTCHGWFLDGRVNAAVPKSVVEIAQVDIFDNKNDGNNSTQSKPSNSPQQRIDIFAPANSKPSPIETPNSDVNSDLQDNFSMSGLWLYSLYDSALSTEPLLRTTVKIDENGDEIITSLCQSNCQNNYLQKLSFNNIVVPDQSLIADYGNFYLEVAESDNSELIIGEVKDKQNNISLYFIMEKLILSNSSSIEIDNFNEINGQKIDTLDSGKLLITKIGENIFYKSKEKSYKISNNIFPSISQGNISNSLLNWTKAQQEIAKAVKSTADVIKTSAEIGGRQVAEQWRSNKRAIREVIRETVERQGGVFHVCDAKSYQKKYTALGNKNVKNLYANASVCSRLASNSGKYLRGLTKLKPLGKLALKGARIGLKIAGRLAIPLLILDLGLTAYEFCVDNPDTCKRIGRNIANFFKQAQSWGEPHLVTFDGFRYDHHGVGEFILAKTTDGSFEVQVREAAVPSSSSVALNSAAAMKVGSDRVAFYAQDLPDSDTSTPIRINGKPTVVQGTLNLPGGGLISNNRGNYIVQWPSGEQVGIAISQFANSPLLEVLPSVSENRQGQMMGLLGNFNGNPNDDLRTRSGEIIKPQSSINEVKQITQNFNIAKWIPIPLNEVESVYLNELHKKFGDSWRVSQSESLFDYPPGKDTNSFTNRAFPNGFQILRMLLPQQVQMAEKTCREAGVGADRLEGCMFDVGVTGNADFAKVAVNALTNVVKDKVEQEIRKQIPVNIPGLRLP